MGKREPLKPLTNRDGEVRELMAVDFADFRPGADVLPKSLDAKLAARSGGLRQTPTKQRISIELSRDVVERFRATGEGWQRRLDAALRDWLDSHSPA
jgi:uncharacterized protein (DUF4415 family)